MSHNSAYTLQGFCECNAGTTRRQGQCMENFQARNFKPRPDNFDPFQVCSESKSCQKIGEMSQ